MTGADFAVLIPARFASTRLPGKVLADVAGKPLIQWVVERAHQIPGDPQVLVLTDDDRVEAAVRGLGGEVVRTRADHASGTDRCAEAAAGLDVPYVVNLQGDEPLFDPADIADLAAAVHGADLATLAHPFEDEDVDPYDEHAVKALVDAAGWAVDFQRAWPEDVAGLQAAGVAHIWHHLGVYAFPRQRLLDFAAMRPSRRERIERLEQLRALAAAWRIAVVRARSGAFGVDTPQDLEALRRRVTGPR